MTVDELMAGLTALPGDAFVRGYEGEGGSWVVVEKDGKTLAQFRCDSYPSSLG
jgi:hypothetical protein